MGTRVSAEAAAIAREAQMRSEASEAARIAYVTQARTLRERRGSFIKMVVVSALVAAICSRLRGTVGALTPQREPSRRWGVYYCLRGGLAQLGERGLCKPEVRGSIPLTSTMMDL